MIKIITIFLQWVLPNGIMYKVINWLMGSNLSQLTSLKRLFLYLCRLLYFAQGYQSVFFVQLRMQGLH